MSNNYKLQTTNYPLLVIVGPTGSGKSALSIELAKKFNGEIICADSRTVYKGMDIGTAKPSKTDQTKVRHHLLDIIKPDQSFNVAEFKKLAAKAIDEITKRDKLPILVGGSGLYIDAIIYDFTFSPNTERDPNNPRHSLLTPSSPSNKILRNNTLIIGLTPSRHELELRLKKRVDDMVDDGFIDEVKELLRKYPALPEAFKATGYKAFISYLSGEINLEQAKTLFIQNDLNLAKRQRTWFKRNKSIHWITDKSKAVELTTTFLNT